MLVTGTSGSAYALLSGGLFLPTATVSFEPMKITSVPSKPTLSLATFDAYL